MTERIQNKNLRPAKPGEVRNPNGRPKGSRNKLGEAFIEKLHEDFLEFGDSAIVQVRTEDPSTYLRVVASILPKELNITSSVDLSDEQLDKRIRELASLLQLENGAAGTAGRAEEKATAH